MLRAQQRPQNIHNWLDNGSKALAVWKDKLIIFSHNLNLWINECLLSFIQVALDFVFSICIGALIASFLAWLLALYIKTKRKEERAWPDCLQVQRAQNVMWCPCVTAQVKCTALLMAEGVSVRHYPLFYNSMSEGRILCIKEDMAARRAHWSMCPREMIGEVGGDRDEE